jgi:glucans biosynthesis protein
VLDYAVPEPMTDTAKPPQAMVTASAGDVSGVTVQRNPLNGGWRLTFQLDPQDEETIELRAELTPDGGPEAEVWLYRWTA